VSRLNGHVARLTIVMAMLVGFTGCGPSGPTQITSDTSGLLPDESSDEASTARVGGEAAATNNSPAPSPLESGRSGSAADGQDVVPEPLNALAGLETDLPDSSEIGAAPSVDPSLSESFVQNPIPLPEGTAEELLEFANDLMKRPRPPSSEAQYEEIRKIMDARLRVANRILAAEKDIPTQTILAEMKFESLRNLAILGSDRASAEYAAFAEQLSRHDNDELAQLGRLAVFRLSLDKLNGPSASNVDAMSIVSQIEQLLQAEKASTQFLSFVSEAAAKLRSAGHRDESLRVLRATAEKFKNNSQLASDVEMIRKQARIVGYEASLYAVMEGQDGAAGELRALVTYELANPADQTFAMADQAGQVFEMTGDFAAASEVYSELAAAFLDTTDPQEQGRLPVVQFKSKLYQSLSDDSASDVPAEVVTTLRQSEEIRMLTLHTAQQMEFSGRTEPAGRLYDVVQKSAGDALDSQLLMTIESAQKRLGLLGQPFHIDGELVSGDPFDWQQYQGKVVLVDFWATWCGPCLREIPNIKANYERFREQGFEVVGVNLDQERERAAQFLAVNQLPWQTVVSPDPTKTGFENPNAERCGVDAIPFLVLVGRDGNVAALHVRGELLEEKLSELLAH
jgi:thiol-disulfide isomerase/thioredoxin